MEQQRAINALESYVLLSKDAKAARAAADLILRATSDPNTFVFAELLHMPNVHALKESKEYAVHYKLLQIFAWGTWADYQGLFASVTLSTRLTGRYKLLKAYQRSHHSKRKSCAYYLSFPLPASSQT
jgi:COP9 signalosome complex subunit 7